MTQLMLFEPMSPSQVTSAVEFARTATESNRVAAECGETRRTASPAVAPAAQAESNPGMHHMGDLARLVLMRYDLVAKRRAAAAARQAS